MKKFKKKFKCELDSFIQSNSRNQWLYVSPVRVYVRKSRRNVNGELKSVFDVASVSVDENKQGKGYFTAVMECVIETCADSFSAVYVENVINPRFAQHFANAEGWESSNQQPFDISSYIYTYE